MQVRFYATLRDLIGQARLDIPLTGMDNVGQVLEALARTYPALDPKFWDANRKLTSYVTVLLNGRAIEYLQGVETPVKESDVLSLFPPVGGGAGKPPRDGCRRPGRCNPAG